MEISVEINKVTKLLEKNIVRSFITLKTAIYSKTPQNVGETVDVMKQTITTYFGNVYIFKNTGNKYRMLLNIFLKDTYL